MAWRRQFNRQMYQLWWSWGSLWSFYVNLSRLCRMICKTLLCHVMSRRLGDLVLRTWSVASYQIMEIRVVVFPCFTFVACLSQIFRMNRLHIWLYVRYLSLFQSPQWGSRSRQGTHGCSTQEAARFCECQRVNKTCLASLTSVSYDQHYWRSISDSLVKFLVRLAAQLALNSFSSSCHGNSICIFCRVFIDIKTEIFGTFVCIFLWVIWSILLVFEVYYEWDYSRDIAHREAKAADGLAPFGVKQSAIFVGET